MSKGNHNGASGSTGANGAQRGKPGERKARRAKAGHIKAPPRVASAAGTSLLGKYQALASKYDAVVERLNAKARAQVDLYAMAGWALRSSHNGCALIRGGAIAVTNDAFQRLNGVGAHHGEWRRAATGPDDVATVDSPIAYPSLDDLVRAEAQQLVREGDRRERRMRFANRSVTAEISFERALIGPRQGAVLVVVRDVTELVKMEADLTNSQTLLVKQERFRAMGELALGVAHDVNNILGALQLRVQVLLRDQSCRDAQGVNIEALARIVDEGSALVSRLQSFARAESSPPGPVDLNECIEGALEIAGSGLRLRARDSGVSLRIEKDLAELPLVKGVAQEIRHVFVNLLINARDAMPKGGCIRVSGSTTPWSVLVRVEDEGCGIPKQNFERIFQSFFTTKGMEGHGLGLAMAKSVMESSGGSITARNRPDGGACFELRFARIRRRVQSELTRPRPLARLASA